MDHGITVGDLALLAFEDLVLRAERAAANDLTLTDSDVLDVAWDWTLDQDHGTLFHTRLQDELFAAIAGDD